MPIFREAVSLGFESLMVDGSRLSLDENIRVTAEVAEFGHAHGRPVEAELGAVLGHEAGPLPPYEELFASGKGFTDVEEARRFAAESGCDWLSVAVGNIHGAIAEGVRDQKKAEARLNLERLAQLSEATGCPLVLHGGSGIKQEYVLGSFKHGITKVNVGHGNPPGVRGRPAGNKRRRGRAAGVLRPHVQPADRVVLHRRDSEAGGGIIGHRV